MGRKKAGRPKKGRAKTPTFTYSATFPKKLLKYDEAAIIGFYTGRFVAGLTRFIREVTKEDATKGEEEVDDNNTDTDTREGGDLGTTQMGPKTESPKPSE